VARLNTLAVAASELGAAHAMIDTIDLALAECVKDFETTCATVSISDDADVRLAASAMYEAAPPTTRPDEPKGVSMASKATVPTVIRDMADCFCRMRCQK
jgi:hypothetical protein